MTRLPTFIGPENIPFHGHLDTFDEGRPLIFVIRGAFGARGQMALLPGRFPDSDVVLTDLPGMHSPHMAAPGIASFAQAFDLLVRRHFSGRRVMLLGLSIGGVVALQMSEGDVVMALDPPLQTGDLWPLIPRFRRALAETDDRGLAEWMWGLFGVSADRIEPRDYRAVLDTRKPGIIMIGGDPLEPMRNAPRVPGLMTASARAAARDHPTLWAIEVSDSGHNLLQGAPDFVLETIGAGLVLLSECAS